jgi:hypothetical protein
MSADNKEKEVYRLWPEIIKFVRSPLRFFALAALIADSTFVWVASSQCSDGELLKFSIHMFLAIVAAVVLVAVWCPKALYHPEELEDEKRKDIFKDREAGPWVVTFALLAGIIIYAYYYIETRESTIVTDNECKQKIESISKIISK